MEAEAFEARALSGFAPGRFDRSDRGFALIICKYKFGVYSLLSVKNCDSSRRQWDAKAFSSFNVARRQYNSPLSRINSTPAEPKYIVLTKTRSDRKARKFNGMPWEFFTKSFKLGFRDPPRLVLFFMGHLYFGGFVEPSPANAGIKETFIRRPLASAHATKSVRRVSGDISTEIESLECLTIPRKTSFVSFFLEPPLARFFPRVIFDVEVFFIPDGIS